MKSCLQIKLLLIGIFLQFLLGDLAGGCAAMESSVVTNMNTIEQFVARQQRAGHVPNELIHEKSPYLLQHAFNPVHWHPWGEAAFRLARQENKPIFLSIGYSTCHWCHVMEKESFENPEIAALLNKYFISIKVDREERPDIDKVYMTVTQAMTGGGGWPMSVFLTPDLHPFYAGTYFPPEGRYGRPGFGQLLDSIHNAWQSEQEAIVSKADSIVKQLAKVERQPGGEAYPLDGVSAEAAKQFALNYDSDHGGFGSAPKFPRPVVFNFLLRYGTKNQEQKLVDISLNTLKEMAKGGMYDHLAGGFHRYSVDRYWRVPHFEKMLYDQALLIISALEAYQLSHDSFFADIASETIDFVLRDMTSHEGGFYSALDADSAVPQKPQVKSEGAFYLWEQDEIEAALGPASAAVFNYHYGISPEGNTLADPHGDFGSKNVLYAARSIVQTAEKFDLSEAQIRRVLAESKLKLLNIRDLRPHPHLDDKILASWNGLMISALAKGGAVLGNKRYLDAAKRAAGFVRGMLLKKENAEIFHRYRDGEAGIDGHLDDYVFVAQAFMDLYEASFDPQWPELAKMMTERQIEQFADHTGGFFESLVTDSSVIIRMKTDYDGAEPAGNSIAALNLLRLGRMFGDRYTELGETTVHAFAGTLKSFAGGMPQMLVALDFMESKPLQIIIVGKAGASDTVQLQQAIASHFLPNKTVLAADGNGLGPGVKELLNPLAEVTMIDGRATAYVCKDLACLPPTNDPEILREILSSIL